MKIKVGIDRKYVLLQTGQDLGETAEIEVTREEMGETWEAMVSNLRMDRTPPFLTAPRNIKGADAASVALAIRERAAENEKEKQAHEVCKNEELAALREKYRNLTIVPDSIDAKEEGGQWISCYRGYETLVLSRDAGRKIDFPDFECYASCPTSVVDAAIAEFADKVARMQSEVDAHNAAEFQRLLPIALAARAKAAEEKAKADAEAETKRQAELTERAANRLATGYWEKETVSYNERRYSAPWCAKVSFPSGPKAVYDFGDSTGKWGKAGLLRVECKPGDIIAHGQKDLRRPGNSDHTMLMMLPNGRMKEVDKTEAFRIWQERASRPSVADTGGM